MVFLQLSVVGKGYTYENFQNVSFLDTSIIKQRPDDCLISICKPDSSLHFMNSVLINLTSISWTLLVIDLPVDIRPECWQAYSLKNSSHNFSNFIMHWTWQIITENNYCANKTPLVIFAVRASVYGMWRRLLYSSLDFAALYPV